MNGVIDARDPAMAKLGWSGITKAMIIDIAIGGCEAP
jgi:hypothetical protein